MMPGISARPLASTFCSAWLVGIGESSRRTAAIRPSLTANWPVNGVEPRPSWILAFEISKSNMDDLSDEGLSE